MECNDFMSANKIKLKNNEEEKMNFMMIILFTKNKDMSNSLLLVADCLAVPYS